MTSARPSEDTCCGCRKDPPKADMHCECSCHFPLRRDSRTSNERTYISAEGSELMMELFNRMPIESLKSVPEPIAKRIGDFMVANGYRIVFDRWYLQAEPRPAPETVDVLTRENKAASDFIRGCIEALGIEQPPEGFAVSLDALLLQVIGEIESLKGEILERPALKAFVQLCAPHGKDWLTCPECAKAAGIGGKQA